jgi:protein MBA1
LISLFIGIFVPLPLSRWPRKPNEFFQYLWAVTKSSWRARLVTWGMRLKSLPKGSLRPQFKTQARQIVPTAKALHRRLNEAIAAGDLPALRDLCHEPLYDILSRTIEGRPAAARAGGMTWEVVEYHSPWTLPRLVFQRASLTPESRYGQQSAIVAFDTTQRLTRRDPRTGEVAEGGVKEQRKRENMVLMRSVDITSGYQPEEWKVWGFEPETTLKAYVDMDRGTKALEQSELEQRARTMGLRK